MAGLPAVALAKADSPLRGGRLSVAKRRGEAECPGPDLNRHDPKVPGF